MAFLIGIVAGLRTATAPAAVSWAVRLGWLDPGDSWASFLGTPIAVGAFSLFALVEYGLDLLPQTPSRRVPMQFGARIVSGGFCGAAIAAAGGSLIGSVIAGAAGAVVGTLGGSFLRSRIGKAIGRDWPVGLAEDAVAIAAAFLILSRHG
jgi:uncharacterized membrane protein